ncbi:hypothetical protein E2C01_062545 [Portunus trituberculatus]|uniref:DUF4371 domain-containing protein n=1 Tax=Portunus trituberculatus TaxID=210409 RepID=A0A5B7HFL5_PORTR|nr:hypothetical protein [Portunus trituberculatus]
MKENSSAGGLEPINEATGEALFKVTSDLLRKCGIAIENCIGFSCDGASNMIGESNFVWSRIKVTRSTKVVQKKFLKA